MCCNAVTIKASVSCMALEEVGMCHQTTVDPIQFLSGLKATYTL